ncbi:hypothetical protein C8Q72DRAFT_813115 [Fomitopsis betulina]|nr:hypothetical protein C8Q72DRAFT_813115 [Fomitopsis betulina]
MNIVQVEGILTDPKPIVDLPELPPDEQRRLWRKVDKRILPILSVMYLCCYLDRGNIGAKVSYLGIVTLVRSGAEPCI